MTLTDKHEELARAAPADYFPAHGNQRSEWDAGCRFDFENPDHR